MRCVTPLSLKNLMLLAVLTAVISTNAFAGKPTPPPAFPPMPIDYVLTWLPAPNGTDSTWANSSNTAGTVAGVTEDADGNSRACIWTASGAFDLNDLANVPAGWDLITARAINESGQIVGTARHRESALRRVYRWDPATDVLPAQVTLMGDLSTTIDHQITYGRPLNNLGDVAYSMNLADGLHTYVQAMDGSVFHIKGYGFNSISDSRQLVGSGPSWGVSSRWTIATNQVEQFRDLRATDINSSGHFVGDANTNGRTYKAMRYQSSTQLVGPSSSRAYGINESSDVVGYVNDTGVGFVFTNTYGYVDLDTLVVANQADDLSRWDAAISIQPMKITNHAPGEFGEISGTAFFANNTNMGFVLTPVPAP